MAPLGAVAVLGGDGVTGWATLAGRQVGVSEAYSLNIPAAWDIIALSVWVSHACLVSRCLGAFLLWLVNNAALNVVCKTCLRPGFQYIWVYKWK